MKLILKRIAACVVFISILLFSFYKVSNLLEVKNAKVKYDRFFDNDTDYDVIFMGTSHAYHSIFTQDLWKNYGISAYNWGFSHGTPVENYYVLREAIKYKKPKLAVIDLYGIMEYEDKGNGKYISGRIEQRHTQFDALPFTLDKVEAVKDIYDDYDDNYDFLFDFAMYHNRWYELTQKDFDYTPSVEKGSGILYGYKKARYKKASYYDDIEINSVCSQYVSKIVDLCKENDIQLLFVYLPYPAPRRQQSIANELNNFLAPYDCDYVNMLDEGILNPVTDAYKDASHLNYMGGYKTTMWMGDYLMKHYDLTDHRSDDKYASWDKEYNEYVDFKVSRFYKKPNYSSLIQNLLLAYGDDFTLDVQIKAGSKKIQKDETIQELLNTYTTCFPDNINLEEVEQPLYNDKKCSILLTIKKTSTGEEVFKKGYKIN